MAVFDASWNCAELAHGLCDDLVARGHLKVKPAFIRTDREAKIVEIFEKLGLDGAKMETFTNPGAVEMLLRRGTAGEAWVQQVVDALVAMLPEDARTAKKGFAMDESTKSELAAAQEKTAQRMARLEQQREEDGETGGRDREPRGGRERDAGGKSGGGRGYNNRGEDRDDESPRGWGDAPSRRPLGGRDRDRDGGGGGGGRREGGGGFDSTEYCNEVEPRKEKGKGKGKYTKRSEMQCLNCKGFGHKSRDCPEPVNEDAVRERLAAKSGAGGEG